MDRGAVASLGVQLPERYDPIRKIARGGMATVWCAHDRTLDRQVAIKMLAEPYAHDELAGRRFTREARAAARLSGHAHVVTIYDVGRTAPSAEWPLGRPFIVMEHLAGGTAADALRTGEFDQALALTWLRQAAGALDYAHRRGVIHRDVKLANFLLDRERVLHVADFGIAQLGSEDTLTGNGEVLGTAAYLAPERALGLPATEASDRYAFAVAAFELLVGERPFTAAPFTVQARQHLEEPPPSASRRNPSLPPAIDRVLARGMAKNPEDRFPTLAEFVDALDRQLGPARAAPRAGACAASAAAPSAATPYRTYGGGRLAAFVALAAVIFAIAGAAAATLIPGGGHPRLTRHASALVAQRPTHHTAVRHVARDQSRARTTRTGTTPTPANPAPAPAPPTQATALEAEGHQLMLGGDYTGAIPILRQAVASAPRSSLTYAYALYDLGHSLRLAGDPRAAVSVLWQRLQIPNQTDVVRNELALALEALGQTAANQVPQRAQSSGGAAPGGGGGAPDAGAQGANSQGD